MAGLVGVPRGSRSKSNGPGSRAPGRSTGGDGVRGLPMPQLTTGEATKARQEGVQRRDRGLGWMSLGLGVAQLAAPDTVRRIIGVDDSPTSRALVPLVGARELVHAAGLLTSRRKGFWAWTRVVGDAMDLT